ncbi:unnamed protein product [Bursaphelenchus okinawaensis]|uniref:UDP-glucuronosyltransferase n=1 Tax=Bursaphelenchus okinawaensis TaxID=465554 RepID=A0A811K0X8_9BILA|nr:unnamed protein product [Bursaphelenchus okinawaensis]CAG9089545.1 unnamed protein product [Bursaphelenchus okinawaensis]
MAKIADVVQESGHNVTFYQQEIFKTVHRTGALKAKVVVKSAHIDFGPEPYQDLWHDTGLFVTNPDAFRVYADVMSSACESQLNDEEYMKSLKNEKYDLALVEFFDICSYAILERIGVKRYISLSALTVQQKVLRYFGMPANIAFVPGMSDNTGAKMTFLERTRAFLTFPFKTYEFDRIFYETLAQNVKQIYGHNFDYEDKLAHSSYVFVNIDEHLSFQMPLSTKFVFTGGVGQDAEAKPLPKSLQSIFNNSKTGVILISFGSIVQSFAMPKAQKNAIISTVKQFPDIDFIWKYEQIDTVGENITNLHKINWVPQTDLLSQPKLLAFVTHGGLNSVSESAHKGKPMICVPIFADQNNNCYSVEEKGLAVVIPKWDLTMKRLEQAVRTVAEDEQFRLRSTHFSRMMKDKPFKAKDRIIGFVNHALQYDVHSALDLPSRHLSTMQYYFLDVLLLLSAVLLVKGYIAYRFIRRNVVHRLVKDKIE